MSLSVVVPVFNEQDSIAGVIADIKRWVLDRTEDVELLVVDDASTDQTPEILTSLKSEIPQLRILRTDANSGHGATLRRGYLAASREWIFQVDSDAQFAIEDFLRLDACREQADFILGYREQRQDSRSRLYLSRFLSTALRLLFGVELRDANCPFRLMRTAPVHKVVSELPDDLLMPNVALAVHAEKKARLMEIAVRHRPRLRGRGSLVSWRLLRFCWQGSWQLFGLARMGFP